MKRIEVILTQAIEEDFVNLYEAACKEWIPARSRPRRYAGRGRRDRQDRRKHRLC